MAMAMAAPEILDGVAFSLTNERNGKPYNVHYTLYKCSTPCATTPPPLVIFVHGMSAHARAVPVRRFATECIHQGFDFIAWDAPAHGRSSSRVQPDAPEPLAIPPVPLLRDAFLRFVMAVAVPLMRGNSFVVCGHSFGAGLALDATPYLDDHRCAGVILLAPMCENTMTRLGRTNTRLAHAYARAWWIRIAIKAGRRVRDAMRCDPLFISGGPTHHFVTTCLLLFPTPERVSRVSIPLILARGKKDELVPRTSMRTLCTWAVNSPCVQTYEDEPGRHNLLAAAPQRIAEWCSELVGDRRITNT